MTSLPQGLVSGLVLSDEIAQLEVCSSYNFHPEESFKVAYWKRALLDILPQYLPEPPILFSSSSVRCWWSKYVANRALSGLPGILARLCEAGDLWRLKDAEPRARKLYQPQPFLSFSTVTSWFSWSSKAAPSPLNDSEEVVNKSVVFSLAKKIVSCQPVNRLGVVLIIESDIVTHIHQFLANGPSATSNPAPRLSSTPSNISPLSAAPSVDTLTTLVILAISDHFRASPFMLQNQRGLKLYPSGRSADVVTAEEVASVAHRVAMVSLETLTGELEKKLNLAETKCREYLRDGRKLLAANFLKEKKLIEGKVAELHNCRLRLQENANLAETSKIQQVVVETLSWSNAVTKVEVAALAGKAEKVQDDYAEMSVGLDVVSGLFNSSGFMVDDVELEKELEALTMGVEKEKHQATTRASIGAFTAEEEELLRQLPPVPTHSVNPSLAP